MMTMQQVVVLDSVLSGPSFQRGELPLYGQSPTSCWTRPRTALAKHVAAANCCPSISSTEKRRADGRFPRFNWAAGYKKCMLMDVEMKTSFAYKKDRIAAANCAVLGETRPPKFGVALKEYYTLSEPRKVDGADIGTEDSVLQRLKQGFVKFKKERFLKEAELFSQLADGQQPKVMVIACADSRVCPTMLMGLNPGEVFTVRNVANLVPPCEKDRGIYHGTSAALEFAVNILEVEHIIVMGHRNCGGIRALMSRNTEEIESDFIGSWMSCAVPAKKHTLVTMEGKSFTDQCKYCEKEAINVSLANLITFPWIQQRFESGKLGLHGWYYDFVEGELTSWEVQRPVVVAGATR